jgi:hypothetical protein
MLHQKLIWVSQQARGLKQVPKVCIGNKAQVLMMEKARSGKALREGL